MMYGFSLKDIDEKKPERGIMTITTRTGEREE